MPHVLLFQFRFLFYFCGISRQTVILISYGLFCFAAWLIYVKYLSGSRFLICWQQAGHVEIFVLIKMSLQLSVLIFSFCLF